jgi:carbonic anhydrase/acetyltransferase-like protein (isoleucine patch superfamily)
MENSNNIQKFKQHCPHIAKGVYVHPTATIIGQVTLGENSSVWPGAVIRGDINFISIGKNTNIQDLSILHVNHRTKDDPEGSPLIIGDNVTIGHAVILHGCSIADECLIGMGSIVMDKVMIEKHVLLAAGSLVSSGALLESGHLYMGRPAKKIRTLTEDEILSLQESAHSYVQGKDEYMQGN